MTVGRKITLLTLLLALLALQALPYLPVAESPVQVAWIEESGDSTPATADVRDSKAWRDACDECSIKPNVFDVSQIRSKHPKFTASAEAAGLPCVAFLYPSGRTSFQKPPASGSELAALIRKAGGK
jgi:hypothetical protein